mgnify:CR=1 FL=1
MNLHGSLDYYGKWFFKNKKIKFNYINSGVLLLNLEKIRLKRIKIDSKDIFLMMIYTRNEKYMSIEDIKKINQYGRRLYSPWIPYKRNKENDSKLSFSGTECPEYLSFQIGNNSHSKKREKQSLNYSNINEFQKCIDSLL